MVDSELFKKRVQEIVAQDYQVEFLGENFDTIVKQLTEIKIEKIYNWLNGVIKKKIQPILIGSNKPYKEWNINQLLTFRYPFKLGNTEYRILLVKVKNQLYIEFHLGDHKYYDKIRKDLDLKKTSY